MNIRLISFAAIVLAFFSCTKNTVDPVTPIVTPPVGLAVSSVSNASYGTDVMQKYDYYLPANRTTTTTKVLIIVHGGGWVSGDKSEMTPFVDIIKQRLPDYAVFNVNYRLAALPNINPFPTQETDIKTVVDLIYSKRTEYNISDKFALLGASAGGHLVLLQAYKNNVPKIKAVVDLYGPTDLVDMYNNPASSAVPASFIGYITTASPAGNPTNSAAAFAAASPINFVTAQCPPTIIFQGGLDSLVRPFQSSSLNTKLGVNNVTKQYVFYPLEGHAYAGASLLDTFDKAVAFLTANVQ